MGFYYGGRRTVSVTHDYKKEIPRLSKIDNLSLKDLVKIKAYLINFPLKSKSIAEENNKAKVENDRIAKVNEERRNNWLREKQWMDSSYDNQFIKPIENTLASLKKELEPYKTSALGSFLSSDVIKSRALGREAYFKGTKAMEIVLEIEELRAKLTQLAHSRPATPKPHELDLIPIKTNPNEYTVLTVSGSKVRVFYWDFKANDVERLIGIATTQIEKEQEKIKEIKARADRTESAIRNQAKQYSRGLSDQLSKLDGCPYCGDGLNKNNFHQDHIHPVSKGGLSTPGNLVFVCVTCNLKKSNKSLRIFLREQGFSFLLVSDRLDLLGKH
jgi:hypothetical protein